MELPVMEFKPIGIARSRLFTAGAPPFQSVFSQEEGEIEVFPEFREGLKSIEGFSHLIILSCFDRATRKALIEQPLIGREMHPRYLCMPPFQPPQPYWDLVCILNEGERVHALCQGYGSPRWDAHP